MTTVLLGLVALARSAGMFCSRNASVPDGWPFVCEALYSEVAFFRG